MISQEEKEKRKKQLEFGLGMNALGGGPPPSGYALELAQEYIEGRMEVDEIVKILVEKYTEKP